MGRIANFRRLAAIDIAFLGFQVILAEFLCGAVLSTALGAWVLLRSHSHWQVALGIYLLGLGMNYLPLVVFALSVGSRQNARLELASELADQRRAMSKYRRLSLLLLVPFLVPLLILIQGRSPRPPFASSP